MYKYRHYDEVIMSINFLTSGAISYNYHNGDDRSCYYCNNEIYCPTYEQCISAGDIPIAVLDIAIVYKGYINYGFEVYYKIIFYLLGLIIFFNNNFVFFTY